MTTSSQPIELIIQELLVCSLFPQGSGTSIGKLPLVTTQTPPDVLFARAKFPDFGLAYGADCRPP
jgi:hypothetical protein